MIAAPKSNAVLKKVNNKEFNSEKYAQYKYSRVHGAADFEKYDRGIKFSGGINRGTEYSLSGNISETEERDHSSNSGLWGVPRKKSTVALFN